MKPLTKDSTIDDIIAYIMESKRRQGDIKPPPRQLKTWPKHESELWDIRICKVCNEEKPIEQFKGKYFTVTDAIGNIIKKTWIRSSKCRPCENRLKYQQRHHEDGEIEGQNDYSKFLDNL